MESKGKEVKKFSIYKAKNLFTNHMKGIINNNTNQENPTSNKYSELVEKLFQQRAEEQQNEKEFNDKIKVALSHYEKEEHMDFHRFIKSEQNLKDAIINQKGDFFKKLSSFEENILNYFLEEVNDTKGYTKINNKEFEMSYKLGTGNDKTITLKFEKELDINVIDLISLIYEVGVYPKWFPFCEKAETVTQISKAKKLVYMVLIYLLYQIETFSYLVLG